MEEVTYRIVRKYADETHPDNGMVIKEGLTREEAKTHCKDPDTHESGVWFDCFYEEGSRPRSLSFMDKLCALQSKNL